MNQQQKQVELLNVVQKLKRAASFAEHLIDEPVRPETMSTLWTLSNEAHAQVTKLKSIASVNPEPHRGP